MKATKQTTLPEKGEAPASKIEKSIPSNKENSVDVATDARQEDDESLLARLKHAIQSLLGIDQDQSDGLSPMPEQEDSSHHAATTSDNASPSQSEIIGVTNDESGIGLPSADSTVEQLSIEQIEEMEKAEAGGESGGHDSDLTNIGFGLGYFVNSLPRDLGISPLPGFLQQVIFPLIQSAPPAPINLIPSAQNDSIGANGEPLTFYEKALADGTAPGSEPLIIRGNVLSNDNLGDQPDKFVDLSFPGADVVKTGNVWTIDNGHAILTLYVADEGSHKKGDFSYELYNSVQEPNSKGPIELQDIYTYTFQDASGDKASANIIASIIDDKPLVTLSADIAVEPSLTVDEHNIGVSNSTDFSGSFIESHIFGADGPAASNPLVTNYTLSISNPTGVDSGLQDSATHQDIFLIMNNGVVEGHVGSINGALSFTVSVDTNTGVVTLNQILGIVQPDGTNPDTNEPVSMGTANLIQLTRSETITDGDGDSQSAAATINIADHLIFLDAGPSVSVNTTDSIPSITVDENAIDVPKSANFASSFSDSVSYGADGPAANSALVTNYVLSIANPAGTNSGLQDSATHQDIFLIMNNGVVEGHVGSINGALSFTVSVDTNTGVVTLDQKLGIVQPDGTNPDTNEAVSMTIANLIQLTRSETATDGDGDSQTAAATINIADHLTFLDAGPHVSVNTAGSIPSITVDENAIDVPKSANFASSFSDSVSYGPDGPAANTALVTNYVLSIANPAGTNSGLQDSATHQNIFLIMNNGVVEGHVGSINGALSFTVSVNANTGVVTLDQKLGIVQPDGTNPDTNEAVSMTIANLIQLTRSETATDGDGDSSSSSATINIADHLTFLDAGPHVSVNTTGSIPSITVDENAIDVPKSANFASSFSDSVSYGPDGPAANAALVTNYALSISNPAGTNSGLQDSATHQNIFLIMNNGVVEGHVGSINGALSFTVSVNANTGVVTLDQKLGIVQPDGTNPDTNEAVSMTIANLIQLTRSETATDGDGDSQTAAATVNIADHLVFLDAGPHVSVNTTGSIPSITVDENAIDVPKSANFASSFSDSVSYGPDGPAANAALVTNYILSIANPAGTNSGLQDSATHQNIFLIMNNGVVEGHVGSINGALSFTVSVDSSGNVTLDQKLGIVQPDGTNPDTNEAVSMTIANLIQLTRSETATDGDGDSSSSSATINIADHLTFLDAGPHVSVNTTGTIPSITVDENAIDVPKSANFASSFSDSVSYGPDGPAANAALVTNYVLSISNPAGTNSGLQDSATHQNIFLIINNGVVEGHVGSINGALSFTVSVNANTGVVTLDQKLGIVQPDGTNPDTNEAVSMTIANLIQLTRSETATDGDGDSSSSSATINIADHLTFLDAGPHVSVNTTGSIPSITVDENAIDVPKSANFASSFSDSVSYGPDGPAANAALVTNYVLSISNPAGTNSGLQDSATHQNIFLIMNNGVVEGHVGSINGALSFTVSVNANTGVVTLDQKLGIVQPDGTNPDTNEAVSMTIANLIQLTRSETATDGDGDSQSAAATVNIADHLVFLDAGPHVSVNTTGSIPSITVDENAIDVPKSANFASSFSDSVSYGPDGPAANAALVTNYALSIANPAGTNSGLVDSATHQNIFLIMNNGVVEGHVGSINGALSFTVSVNANTGVVTLDQKLGIVQPDGTNPDTNEAVSMTIANLIQLTRSETATDGDGDSSSSSATINIADHLTFLDAGPHVSVNTTGSIPSITVDENAIDVPKSANFASSFSDSVSYGPDGPAANAALVTNYVLSIANPAGTNSGLQDSATHQNIFLIMNNGVVEGHVGSINGALSFTVSVNANTGVVTLDQKLGIVQPDGTNPDTNEAVSMTIANLIQLTRSETATDGDGDSSSSSATINIADHLTFLDAGPHVSVNTTGSIPSITVDENAIDVPKSANFASSFSDSVSYGPDGPAANSALVTNYVLSISNPAGTNSGLLDSATHQNIFLIMNNGVVEGHVGSINGALSFTVSVNANTGVVTLDQKLGIVQPDGTNPDTNEAVSMTIANLIQLTRSETATDGDGDSSSSSATINIADHLVFLDAGPHVSVNTTGSIPSITVDENAIDVPKSANFASSFSDSVSYGPDGPAASTPLVTNYVLSIANPAGTNSGLQDSATHQNIFLIMNNGVVEGHVGSINGALSFTVSVNANTGVVTLDQKLGIVQPDGTNPDTNEAVSMTIANLIQLTRSETATDGDGDSQSAAATINIADHLVFLDAGPHVSVNVSGSIPSITVDENAIDVPKSANFASSFSDSVSYGPDGPAANAALVTNYVLSISNPAGTNSGLQDSATHQNIFLIMNNGVVEGHVGSINGALSFTVSVNANTGVVTLDQKLGIVQPDGTNPDTNEAVSMTIANLIQLTRSETATDGDGDSSSSSATINIADHLTFLDAGPHVSVNTTGSIPSITVDEHAIDVPKSANFASSFSDSVSYGPDGPAANAALVTNYVLSISNPAGTNSGLQDSATHQNIFLIMNNGVVEGHVGSINGALSFTVSVNANTGVVTLDQKLGIVQPDGTNPDTNEAVSMTIANLIQLTRSETATDGDGDSQSAAATVNIADHLVFLDAGPTVTVSTQGSAPSLTVDEHAIGVSASASFSANFADSITYGPDGPAAGSSLITTYSLSISSAGVDSGLIDTATKQHILLTLVGGVIQGRTSGSNDLVFTVTINSTTGVVTLNQLRAIVQSVQSNPDTNEAITLSSAGLIGVTRTETATDGDGDSSTNAATLNIGQSLIFKDVGPAFSNVNDPGHNGSVDIVAQNPASTTTNSVQLVDWQYNADGVGSNPFLQNVTGNVQLVSSSPTQITLNLLDASSNIVATIILNANGTDSIQYFHRNSTITEVSLGTGDANPGGPEVLKYIDNAATNLHVEVTADNGQLVNPSTQGWAVKNNLIDSTEGIIFTFTKLNDVNHPSLPVYDFQFAADGFTGGKKSNILHVVVTYDNNTTQSFDVTVTSGQVVDVRNLPGFQSAHLISSVDVENLAASNGSFRLNGVEVFATSTAPPPDLNYNFTLSITDGDGDSSSQAFSIQLQGAAATSSPGYTVDGPIAGATIFQDFNNNSIYDAGESSTISSSTGAYNILLVDTNADGTLNHSDGRLVSVGGTDTETGLSYNIPLFAPLNSQVITPLTSILEIQIEQNNNISPQTLMANLVAALGLPQGANLLTVMPTEANSNLALEQGAGVMTLSIQLSNACAQILGLSATEAATKVYQAIGDELINLSAGTQADFANPEFMHAILGDLSQLLGIDAAVFNPIFNTLITSQVALEASIHNLPADASAADAVDAISAVQHLTQGAITDAISSYYQGTMSAQQLDNLTETLIHHANSEVISGNVLAEQSPSSNITEHQDQAETISTFKYYNEHNQLVSAQANQVVVTHQGGLLSIHSDGSFSYVPAKQGGSFNEMIEYTAKDAHGKQEVSTISIHTADINPDAHLFQEHAQHEPNDNYIVDVSDMSWALKLSMRDIGIQGSLSHDSSEAKGRELADSAMHSMAPDGSSQLHSSPNTAEHYSAPPAPIENREIEHQIQHVEQQNQAPK